MSYIDPKTPFGAEAVVCVPTLMPEVVTFEVRGIPQTQGSMKAFMPKGARFPIVTHGNPKIMQWRNLVAMEAKNVAPADLWTQAVGMDVMFFLQRPKGHYKGHTNNLTVRAPARPDGSKNDLDKMLRGILDALIGVFYRDDGQVCEITCKKEYGPAGAKISLWQL